MGDGSHGSEQWWAMLRANPLPDPPGTTPIGMAFIISDQSHRSKIPFITSKTIPSPPTYKYIYHL